MATRRLNIFMTLTVAMSCICAVARGQRIVDLQVFTLGTNVGIRFQISKGQSCNGYKILHSTDSINFKIVGDIAEVCGSTDDVQIKNFTHNAPLLNTLNYYKIDLFPLEVSKAVSIFVSSPQSNGPFIYPNPFTDRTKSLSFRLPTNVTDVKAFLFDHSGQYIRELILNINTDRVSAEITELRNGLYIVRLSVEEKNYQSKLVVLR